jgi:hypothetical protein
MNSYHEAFDLHTVPSDRDLRGFGLYPFSLELRLVRQAATRAAAFILGVGFRVPRFGFFIGFVSFITSNFIKLICLKNPKLQTQNPKLSPFSHKNDPQGIEQYLEVEGQ